MANDTRNLDWRNVDADSLPIGLKALYDDLKSAQRLAAQSREAFETAFTEMVKLPPTQSYAFGYRFGKLAIAVTDAAPAKPKAKSNTLDFATLQQMSGSPHRSM